MTEPTTILFLTAHGHGTTPVMLDALLDGTEPPIDILVVDMMTPESVSAHIDAVVAEHPRVERMSFDGPISRQAARLAALREIRTEFTILCDNDVLVEPGCVDTLLAVQAETDADVVSPIILTRGGRVHYSGGRIVDDRRHRFARRNVDRPQCQPDAPMRALLDEVTPSRVEIDYTESHLTMYRSDDLRLSGVLEARCHNVHTSTVAGYRLKTRYGRHMILDPGPVASIVPISFGYDLPWLMLSSMRRDWLRSAYRTLARTIGPGPGSSLKRNLPWHVKSLKFALASMAENDRVHRDDFLQPDEIPDEIDGLDVPLRADTDELIARDVLPALSIQYPELMSTLHGWLDLSYDHV